MMQYLVWDSEGITETDDTVIEDLFMAVDGSDDEEDSDGEKRRRKKKSKKARSESKSENNGSEDDQSESGSEDKARFGSSWWSEIYRGQYSMVNWLKLSIFTC